MESYANLEGFDAVAKGEDTENDRNLSIALAAVRYCQQNEVDLIELMPDFFDDLDGYKLTPDDYDGVANVLANFDPSDFSA